MNTKITVTTPWHTQIGSRETGLGNYAGYLPAAVSVSGMVKTKHASREGKEMREVESEAKTSLVQSPVVKNSFVNPMLSKPNFFRFA